MAAVIALILITVGAACSVASGVFDDLPAPEPESPSYSSLYPYPDEPDTPELDALLVPLASIHQAWQAEVAAATAQGVDEADLPPEPEPREVRVFISSRSGGGDPVVHGENRRSTLRLLESHNAVVHYDGDPRGDPTLSGNIGATVSMTALHSLAENDAVRKVTLHRSSFPYQNVDYLGSQLILDYKAGLSPEEDLSPTFALVSIYIEKDGSFETNYERLRSLLKDESNAAVLRNPDVDIDSLDKPDGYLVAYVPVPMLQTIIELPGFELLRTRRHPVSESGVLTRKPLSERGQGGGEAAEEEEDDTSAVPLCDPSCPDPADGYTAHGARWRSNSLDGDGVKIGIIDAVYQSWDVKGVSLKEPAGQH